MTGAEHYAEAERLIAIAVRKSSEDNDYVSEALKPLVGAAQVHATLALAALEAEDRTEIQVVSEPIDEHIARLIQDHVETEPHVYPDGSTS